MHTRSAGQSVDHIGFAWAPKNLTGLATADYTAQTAAILDRLAAAVRDSAAAPEAACAPAGENVWCSAAVDGAAFTEAWKTFATWSVGTVAFSSAPASLTAGTPAGPLTVQLQTAGVAETATSPVDITLSSTSLRGTFSTSASGPWTSTLTVTVPAGASSASFYYEDTLAGTATLTATATGRDAASQAETVAPRPVSTLSLSPASATVRAGATQAFTAAGTDAYGKAVTVTPTWTSSIGTIASDGTFTAPATSGSGAVTANAGGVSASATVTVTQPVVQVSSIRYSTSFGRLVVTFAVDAATGAAVPGAAISFTIDRNSYAWASGSATTGSAGTVTVTASTGPSGCYTTTIRGVAASGFAWDGATPSNLFCK
jgi:hypothetical protein